MDMDCSNLYSAASFPNVVGDQTQNESLNLLKHFVSTFGDKRILYKYFLEFVCYAFLPKCNSTQNHLVLPCKEFCNDFRKAYKKIIWPPQRNQIDCDYFPPLNRTFPCFYERVTCEAPYAPNIIFHGERRNFYPVESTVKYSGCVGTGKITKAEESKEYFDKTTTCLHSGKWSDMRESTCDPKGKELAGLMILGLFLFFIMVGVIFCMVFCLLKWRRRRKQFKRKDTPKRNSHLGEKEVLRKRKFDSYVCYSYDGEHDFVTDTVLPVLEENHSPPFKLCIHMRDFEPGLPIIDNIRSAIRNSNSAIIIMSQDDVNNPWCTKELEECCTENMKDPEFKLFIIMMQERDALVNINQYESYVQKFLSSDKVLDRHDPDCFKKISRELSQSKPPSMRTVLESVTEGKDR